MVASIFDKNTLGLPGISGVPGRKPTGKALSNKVRQRRFKERIEGSGGAILKQTPINRTANNALMELQALHPDLSVRGIIEAALIAAANQERKSNKKREREKAKALQEQAKLFL